METDDRVVGVIKQLDDAMAELDKMDLLVGVYKTQLNVRLQFSLLLAFLRQLVKVEELG